MLNSYGLKNHMFTGLLCNAHKTLELHNILQSKPVVASGDHSCIVNYTGMQLYGIHTNIHIQKQQ